MNFIGYKKLDKEIIEIVDSLSAEPSISEEYAFFDRKGDMIRSVENETKKHEGYTYAGRYERETKTIRIYCVPKGVKLQARTDKVTDNLYALYFDLSLRRGSHMDELRR